MVYRKLCVDDHDARVVPSGSTACGHEIQQGPDGCEHLSRYL